VIKSRRTRLVGYVARIGRIRNEYRVLVEKKSEGKRPPGKHRHRWQHNIKMDLKEIG
jgi:hypothetical protein